MKHRIHETKTQNGTCTKHIKYNYNFESRLSQHSIKILGTVHQYLKKTFRGKILNIYYK